MEPEGYRIRKWIGIGLALIGALALSTAYILWDKKHFDYDEVQYGFYYFPTNSEVHFKETRTIEQETFSLLLVLGPGLMGLGVLMGRKRFNIKHIWGVILIAGLLGCVPLFFKPLQHHVFYAYVGGFDAPRKLKCIKALSAVAIYRSAPINGIPAPSPAELKDLEYETCCTNPSDLSGAGPTFELTESRLIFQSRREEIIEFMKLYYFKLVSELAAEKGLPPILELPKTPELVEKRHGK